MLRAALRRFLILAAGVAGTTFVLSVVIGLALGASFARAVSIGFYLVGCFLLVIAFFVGNRGPVRLKHEAQPFFGPRFLRWATPDEHTSTISESAIFIVVGLIIILVGLVVDNRYTLV